jgi:tRNA pseudouridine38-40 synthase
MKTYKLIIAYDGTDFYGWQIQSNAVTIASTMQNAFKNTFGHSINLLAASRTDTGVHALGQVARFSTELSIDSEQLREAWNNALPSSILIRRIEQTDSSFNPRYNVHQKTYYYHLFYKRPLPFVARFGWLCKYVDLIDWEKFNKALHYYRGEHDFASFCKVAGDESTIRTIDEIKMERLRRFGVIRIIVKGQSFLHFQIRRMIGYAIDVARRPELPVDYIKDLLNNPCARQTLLRAEGCGLLLYRITYQKKER